MKATLMFLSAVVAGALASGTAPAQYYYPAPVYYSGYPTAPDMCGPYFYCTNGCTWYGPSYNVYPPFPPVGGIMPGGGQGAGQMCGQIYHPWARSPRDYFMWTEAQRERITRETRPPFVP
jgi:hypothetical protein